MKKIMMIIAILLLVCGCSSGGNNQESSQSNTVQAPQTTTDNSNSVSNNNSVNNGNSVTAPAKDFSNDKIEIIKDYFCKSHPSSSYTYHIIVVKNNNDVPVSLSSNSVAYDADDKVIGADGSRLDVIGPNATSAIVEMIESIDGVVRFETKVTASDAKYYDEIDSMISMELNATSDKVMVSLTNNGEKAAKFVQAHVVFLDDDGNIVYYDRAYVIDQDSEIKPGETITEQIKSRNSFSNAEVYIEGRAEK